MKIYAWINVIIRLLIVDLLFTIFAPVVYVPIYIFRTTIRWFRQLPLIGWMFVPLWIFLDDTGDYGNKQECWDIVGCEPDTWWHKFKCAYYWSGIRNVAWNSYSFNFFKGIDPTLPCTDYLFVHGNKYNYDNNLNKTVADVTGVRFNAAEFYDHNADGSHTISLYNGTYLDLVNSQFGKSKYYFKNNGHWWIFYSYCDIVKIQNGVAYIHEVNIGGADNRVLIRLKRQHALIDN